MIALAAAGAAAGAARGAAAGAAVGAADRGRGRGRSYRRGRGRGEGADRWKSSSPAATAHEPPAAAGRSAEWFIPTSQIRWTNDLLSLLSGPRLQWRWDHDLTLPVRRKGGLAGWCDSLRPPERMRRPESRALQVLKCRRCMPEHGSHEGSHEFSVFSFQSSVFSFESSVLSFQF